MRAKWDLKMRTASPRKKKTESKWKHFSPLKKIPVISFEDNVSNGAQICQLCNQIWTYWQIFEWQLKTEYQGWKLTPYRENRLRNISISQYLTEMRAKLNINKTNGDLCLRFFSSEKDPVISQEFQMRSQQYFKWCSIVSPWPKSDEFQRNWRPVLKICRLQLTGKKNKK